MSELQENEVNVFLKNLKEPFAPNRELWENEGSVKLLKDLMNREGEVRSKL
jgi:hypothetical protein